MRRTLIILNCIALLWGVWLVVYTLFASGCGPARVNEMYRYDVIDKEKVGRYAAESYPPEIAKEIEHSLGGWIQDLSQRAAVRSSWTVVGFSILNIVGLFVRGRQKTVGQQGTAPNAP